jgi:hypothetical protein
MLPAARAECGSPPRAEPRHAPAGWFVGWCRPLQITPYTFRDSGQVIDLDAIVAGLNLTR